jgi:hypothetical protein
MAKVAAIILSACSLAYCVLPAGSITTELRLLRETDKQTEADKQTHPRMEGWLSKRDRSIVGKGFQPD